MIRQGFDMRDKFYEARAPKFKMDEAPADASAVNFSHRASTCILLVSRPGLRQLATERQRTFLQVAGIELADRQLIDGIRSAWESADL